MQGSGMIHLRVIYGGTFFQVDCQRCSRILYQRGVEIPGPSYEETVAMVAKHHRCLAFQYSGDSLEEVRKGWHHGERSDSGR